MSESTELPTPTSRPDADVVIFDGNCVFCRQQVARLDSLDRRGHLAFLSLHDPQVARTYPDLTHEELMSQLYVVDTHGRRHGGAAALRYLSRRLALLWPLAPFLHLPFSLPLWQQLYQFVATHRYRISGQATCQDGSCQLHQHASARARLSGKREN